VKPALMKAQAYILAIQKTEQTGYQSTDRDYGSVGYGGSQRGDNSNLQFALEALRTTGLPENHEAFAKAVVFLQRTQNLKSVNDVKGKVPDANGKLMEITSGDDGGAVYYPGESPAGYIELPDGSSIPRSYGSMTYALLKSYTMAGVKADDARVKAAVKWLGEHWTLAENPGADPKLPAEAKYQGLYYYYMVLAQALNAAKVDKLTVAKEGGKSEDVDWRKALRAHVESLQRPDGSWMNERNKRWYEDMDLLCTCYAMLGLEQCR
jgi:squalene-hopene/tetraprenyl-beta-curcumene cyclase